MAINDPKSVLTQIQSLAKQNKEIEVMWLYGSLAKGTATEDSDIDLAIAFTNFIKDPLERALRAEKLAIDWTHKLKLAEHKISIVDINHIPTPLAWEIISQGHVIVGESSNRSFWEFDRICREYEIDIMYHRKHYG